MSPRVALLADHLEEGWTSMDHYAAMLERDLPSAGGLDAVIVRPSFRRRMGRLSWLLGPRHGQTLDRYWNRYSDYPRAVARERGFDLFHVLDQTYAHVVLRFPGERTLVTCHDLDFADPPHGTRLAWLVRTTGAMAVPGLRWAARVLCDSESVRQQVVRRGLANADRVVVIPLGVESEFSVAGPRALPAPVESLLAEAGPGPYLLHVGGMVVRKRLDILLRALARVRSARPGAVLVRAGGPLSPAMTQLAAELGLSRAIAHMPFLSREDLAALFRRADVFVLSSDKEGFGLPVLEAMASGLPVVTRELPSVREVAADSVRYVDEADPEAFAAAALEVLADEHARRAMRERALERASRFRWSDTAAALARVYGEVLEAASSPSSSP